MVQQQGLARHGVLHERGQQRHPQGLPAVLRQPCGVRHHRRQPPAEPHQGAAVRGHRVSGPGALRPLSLPACALIVKPWTEVDPVWPVAVLVALD